MGGEGFEPPTLSV